MSPCVPSRSRCLLGKHHRLAGTDPVPVARLRGETLLMFPRELAPGYYDRVVAACEEHGFRPDPVFNDPPPRQWSPDCGPHAR